MPDTMIGTAIDVTVKAVCLGIVAVAVVALMLWVLGSLK
jgi:hypothetical protein